MSDNNKTDSHRDNLSGSTFLPVESFDIIVFGATGDLSRRKLVPALFHRFCDGQINSDSRIIGVSRTELVREGFQDLVKTSYSEFTGKCPSSYNLSQISARAKRDFAHLFG